jgi:RimJ/RimL family protein N-acetyltransferase
MADFDAFCAMEADPEVRRYVGGAPRTREGAERKFRDVQLRPIDAGLGLMAMIFKADGKYIGYCGLYPNFDGAGEKTQGEAVLGFTFGRSYWGRGLATEAGDVFLRYGFGQLGLSRVVSVVDAGNLASLRVLEKLGFVVVAAEKTGARSFYKLELKKAEPPDLPASERPRTVLYRVDGE